MLRKRLNLSKPLAIVAGAVLSLSPLARGGFVSAGGWTASWDPALDELVGLTPLKTASNSVSFAAHLQFVGGPTDSGVYEPVAFTFQQTSLDAKNLVVIEQEAVVNQTADAWDGYGFMLEPSAASGVQFDGKLTFGSGHNFSIAPFTTHTMEQQAKELYVGGGTIPSGPAGTNVWDPGQFEGALYIDGAPKLGGGLRTFTLLQGPTALAAVPLPTGGLSGLAVIGVLALGKTIRLHRQSC